MPETRTHNGYEYTRQADGSWRRGNRVGGAPINSGVNPADVRANRAQDLAERRFTYQQNRDAAQDAEDAAQPQLTPAQEAVDREFATEYVDWTTGGFADFEKQRDQLAGAIRRLGESDNITGPVVGRMPEFINEWANPEAINTREDVEEVVQRNLRLILGAQFTQAEGERLIARAYNPRLDEATNARRIRRLLQQMQSAAQAKNDAAEYFRENGTLAGWQGRLPRMSDFTNLEFDEPRQSSNPNTGFGRARSNSETPSDISDIMRRYGVE